MVSESRAGRCRERRRTDRHGRRFVWRHSGRNCFAGERRGTFSDDQSIRAREWITDGNRGGIRSDAVESDGLSEVVRRTKLEQSESCRKSHDSTESSSGCSPSLRSAITFRIFTHITTDRRRSVFSLTDRLVGGSIRALRQRRLSRRRPNSIKSSCQQMGPASAWEKTCASRSLCDNMCHGASDFRVIGFDKTGSYTLRVRLMMASLTINLAHSSRRIFLPLVSNGSAVKLAFTHLSGPQGYFDPAVLHDWPEHEAESEGASNGKGSIVKMRFDPGCIIFSLS